MCRKTRCRSHCTSSRTCSSEADILLLLVDHHEFTDIDPQIIRDKVVIDTRGVLR